MKDGFSLDKNRRWPHHFPHSSCQRSASSSINNSRLTMATEWGTHTAKTLRRAHHANEIICKKPHRAESDAAHKRRTRHRKRRLYLPSLAADCPGAKQKPGPQFSIEQPGGIGHRQSRTCDRPLTSTWTPRSSMTLARAAPRARAGVREGEREGERGRNKDGGAAAVSQQKP